MSAAADNKESECDAVAARGEPGGEIGE